ncbi:MAG TPA: Calx-beta domain-containing protein [Verrucomicrobiae bacterium]
MGSFDSYNEVSRYGVCLINTNGSLDQSFNPGSGANVFNTGLSVNTVAMTPDNRHAIIAGSFTSYNGTSVGTSQSEFQSGGVCRVNLNGSIDGTFQPGSGPNDSVYAVAVQPNGQILIGGAFTQYDGVTRNYLARLNANGSLDTSFDPGTTLNGPVYALDVQQTANITTNVVSTSGNARENDVSINVSPNSQGNVIVNYIFPTTNDLQVYYGGTLIFDTGPTATGSATPAQFSVPYGPGNTPILLVANPGGALATGTNYSYGAVVTSAGSVPEVMVGGNFNVSGENYNDIALFNTNGGLDTSFNPTLGADQPIRALVWQPDGHVLIGGDFQNFNSIPVNRLARLNSDGSLDTTDFFVGAGADDTVFSIKYINPYAFNTFPNQNGGTNVAVNISRAIYIGGQFAYYNGTRRLGFARLYTDGTVDTTFLDSTYNQFAGLPKIYSYDAPAVKSVGIQSDGNVMIGGNFNEVGGGEAEMNPRNQIDVQEGIAESFTNKWLLVSLGGTDVEPDARNGVRNRSNIARLIGGATPGPGNLELVLDNSSGDSANRNQVTEPVSIVRTNGFLGPESANFSIIPGTAQSGSDLVYQSAPPMDYLAWQYSGPTRNHSDGLAGYSGFLYDIFNQGFAGGLILMSEVNVTVLPDFNAAGNLGATYQLVNPANSDQLYLGGEDIPVGTALGLSSTPVTLIDNRQDAGTFSFASSTFIATNLSPVFAVVRTGGANGSPSMDYATNSPAPNGGTALPNVDYVPIPITQLTFAGNQLLYPFSINILNHGVVYTNFTEKTINLHLYNLRSSTAGAALGLTNATVRLINPNFAGYLTLSAANYSGQEAPPYGQISFTVNRVAGSEGSLTVEYATADASAQSGKDYIGATNILQWNNGDVSSRTITVPLINTGVVGLNKQFSVYLLSPQLNDASDPGLFYPGSPGSITSATMTISNNNSYGLVQFSATNYLVNESGGFATITVVRSGGDAGPAYVNYATADGTAVAGANYSPTAGTLTFAPNQLAASFQVAITNNGQFGPPPSQFYFNVNLSSPVNLALGSITNAQVSILNDQLFNQPPGSTNAAFVSDINGAVLALAYQTNGQIVAGGSFNDVNGLSETNLVRLNVNGSVDTTFTAVSGGTIQAVVNQTDDRVLIAGQFTNVDGFYLNYIGRLMVNGSMDNSFNVGAGANGPVYSLAETFIGGAREIYAGGAFSMINSVNSQGIVRLNNNASVDQTFNVGSGVDGTVYAIAAYPTNSVYVGDVIIGGSFAHYNGTAVNGIVRLTSNGSIDATFNPGTAATNGIIKAVTIQPDGKVLVGGSFVGFEGFATTNIVRLNGDGSMDTNFAANVAPGANNVVEQIVLQPDTRILVVGQFTQFNGFVRNGVTRLMPTGAVDPTINFGTGASGAVDCALVDPGTGLITLGGAFDTFNGQPVQNIVQLYGLSETGSGAFEFSSPNYQVGANGVVAPVTIVRVGGTSGPNSDGSGNVYVNFLTVTNSGTAVPGVDYSPVSTNVAFPPGAVVETVYIPVLPDYAATNNLNVGLLLTNATPPTIVTNQPTALLTILNVNNSVNFLATFTNVFESVPGGVANIAVVRQGSTNSACAVDFYTTTNGSGVAGLDFYPTNETITFNPGVSQQSAQVLIISNSTLEKTVGMVLTNPVNTVLDAPTNETLTILNNSTSAGQLCFSQTNYTVNESAGSVTVTVIRTNGFAGSVSYGYTTVPGTAQPPVNYQSTTGNAVFDVNTAYSFNIPISQFTPPEGPVTFSVVLTNTTTSAATLIAPTNVTVTIVDDISAGVSFVNATNYFEETNGTVSVLVQRLGNTNSAFSVPFVTTNGTALAGINYLTNSGTLTFTPGETVAGISVGLMNNQNVSNLTFGISLFPPTSPVELLSPSNTVVVITPAAAGITFGSPTNSIAKNAGSIAIPVICLDPSNEPPILNSNSIPLSVSFATTNITALAGNDYIATNGILTFTNGIATNWIIVPIINNSQVLGSRTFGVNLSNVTPVPPGRLAAPTNQVITIIDSNAGLEFSSANYSIDNGGLATITVLRVDSTNNTSSVAYATTPGGSAIPGTDYYPTNGVLTFAPGQSSSSFAVTVIGSSAVEPDKTILLALSSPSNGVLTVPSAATLTVYNQNGSFIVPAGVSLPVPNTLANGVLQSNQLATLNFGFRDAGGLDVSSMSATLLQSANISTGGAETKSYGPLTVNGHSAFQQFSLTPIGTNGQTISANFQLQVTAANNVTTTETNSFALTIGTWTTTWSNTNAIVFSGTTNSSPMIASPYPSIITVSNVGGVLVGVTTTLTNYSCSSPQANEVLLVSPGLADSLLMAGIGDAQINARSVTLTFSNCVPQNFLPFDTSVSTPLTNGVYNPTQYGGITIFP